MQRKANKARDVPRKQKKPLKQSKKFGLLSPLAQQHAKNLPAECVRGFLHARLDPFHSFSTLPCNPLNDTTPSFRYRSKYAFTLNSGNVITNNKSAWFGLNWYRFMCNNLNSITYSIPSSTINAVDSANAHGPLANTSAPFTDANMQNNGYGAKLVGAGIKITNTTPNLYRSGTITLIQNPANANISILTYANSRTRANTITRAYANEQYVIMYNSARANVDDRFLTEGSWEDATGSSSTDYWNCAVAFENIDATNFSAFVEIIGIFEYAVPEGSLAAACEYSPVDPDGAKVVSIAETASSQGLGTVKEYAHYASQIASAGALSLSFSSLSRYLESRRFAAHGLHHEL